jgi:thiamine-monophosphate kinase
VKVVPENSSLEQKFITSICGDFPRHPDQLNQLFEADAEIINLENRSGKFLVIKTDGIHEEIRQKLYEDPWLIGWMTITAPLSDLAATGAAPIGMLLSLVLPADFNQHWLNEFKKGIRDALTAYDTFILGGDTNFDSTFSSAATAVALQDSTPLTRKGIQPGHNLYVSGLMGLGNAFAYAKFFDNKRKIHYQPFARLKEMKMLRGFASACMDTSDGFFPALASLSSVNHTGFDISVPLDSLLHHDANKLALEEGLPAWMLLAGPHGDYELLFTIPDDKLPAFESACKASAWQPFYLGRAKKQLSLHFISELTPVTCAPALVADLYQQSNGDISNYFEMLQLQDKKWSSTLNLV